MTERQFICTVKPVLGRDLIAPLMHSDPELHGTLAGMFAWRRFYAISASAGLYLFGNGEGNDGRFAAIFREVWLAIPDADRNAMAEYWASRGPGFIPGFSCARIDLHAHSKFRAARQSGNCGSAGTELSFYAHVADRMERRHVRSLIAHELGHVMHWARGEGYIDPPPINSRVAEYDPLLAKTLAYLGSPAEREANATAARWGHDCGTMNRWIARHVDWQALPADHY